MQIALILLAFAAPCLAQSPNLQAARSAAKWLNSTAILTKDGVVWPSDPRDPKSVNRTLYAGTPGPVLFFLELYRYTGEQRYLTSARSGADALLNTISTEEGTGLYEGIAGIGFTLGEAYLITHDVRYREGALRCVELLRERAENVGPGIEWNDTTDVIAGSSGTGLFLLWADQELHAASAKELAIKAGEHLLEVARPEGENRLKWMMDTKFPREMPNFSHGTAGVAYFLATLYQQTHEKKFLDAAIAGANYLLSIANTEGDYCLIYHDSENKQLYYLSWCHGPAGTARLFYRLYQATDDPQWKEWVKKSANTLIAYGAPGKAVTPGAWNNISLCCGTTAQAAFLLDMYTLTGEKRYLELARTGTDALVASATRDGSGARWIQAETRVKPDQLAAQTGLMQGASGVGLWLLHIAAFESGKKRPAMVLPDNPFPY